MSEHEHEYLKRVAEDPDITEFDADDLAEIEKVADLGPFDWLCALRCYLDYRRCRRGGGSRTDCRKELGTCLLSCKK